MTVTQQQSIVIDGGDLLVRPPKYPSTEVKEILGGRWDKDEKAWRLAPTALNVVSLGEWYGEAFIGAAPQQVQDLFRLEWGFPGFEEHKDLGAAASAHPAWDTLYPFQRTAVEYLMCNPHRGALLALSPGLGKTPVSVVAADLLDCQRVLIVAPLTLAKNWGKEIDKWSDQVRDWSRATADDKDPRTEVTITNFETLFEPIFRDENGKVVEVTGGPKAQREWIKAGPTKVAKNGKRVPVRERIVQARSTYAEIDWDLIVIDESILLKNRKAVKVGVLQQLAKYTGQVWLLSGSPTAKFKDDLFPQVQTVMPRGFTSYWRFAEFFCVVDRGQWGWSIEGDKPDKDEKEYLKDLMFVRNQKDVLPDLPDYIYDPKEIDLNPDQEKAFSQMLEDWIIDLDGEGDPDVVAPNRLAQATRMQQITSNMCNLEKAAGKHMKSSSAKEDLLVDLIRNKDIETPLLVWTWYVPTTISVATRLRSEFKDLRVGYVVGEMKGAEKDDTIDAYKDGDLDVLVMQMGVGKFGHTLTDTRTVYYHDRSFDSDAYIQTLKRVKRIGLTHRPRLIVPRAQVSADPIVELNLAGKMQSISKVAAHDLSELLRSLGNIEWALSAPDVAE